MYLKLLNTPRKRAVSRIVLGIVVIIVVLLASVGAYYGFVANGGKGPTSTTSTTPTASTTSTTTTGSVPTSLTVEESNQPDSLDPGVSFETSGWEPIQQVYQTLVAPNGRSLTTYVPVLAKNWTVTADGLNYTFALRQDVKFSNGDPFNAYDMWFSIYRNLVINQAPVFIIGQNLGLGHGNVTINASVLNSINYSNPSHRDVSFMAYGNQSVQALGPYVIRFHLGYGTNGPAPYSAFLATLTTPQAAALDPKVVEANGGITDGAPNSWMETNALGTGFYMIQPHGWVQGQSITLVKNPNYWGANLPSSELDYAQQPAILDTIIIYYKPVSNMIGDLKSGFAQMALAPTSQYGPLKQISSINVTILPIQFGSSQNVFWVYMDPYAVPAFQNRLVREAVSYAIDYKTIIHSVFNDQATQWIGPVPPGFPLYNESAAGLQPYSYDPVKAAKLLAQAGYVAKLPNGTVLNSGGTQFPTVNFLYNLDSPSEGNLVQILQSEFAAVGIGISPSGVAFKQYSSLEFQTTGANTTQYPMGLAYYSEDYTASIDYVSALTINGYIGASAYVNSTVIGWNTAAATALNDTTIIQNFQKITSAMYNDYVDIWFYVPYFMTTNQNNVVGMIPNPAGSGCGYFMFYNTVHYTS